MSAVLYKIWVPESFPAVHHFVECEPGIPCS